MTSINTSSDMQPDFAKRSRLFVLVPAVVAAMAACSGDDPVPNRSGLHIVSGGSRIDTIEARLTEPLTVELRDENAQPLANRVVNFYTNSLPTADGSNFKEAITLSGAALAAITANTYRGTTDANGRIQASVRFGQVVGATTVHVVVPDGPDFGTLQRDSTSYTIVSGKPALVILGPRDTALYPAARLELRQSVRDRFRFPTSGTIAATFTSTSGVTAASTGVVTPRVPGRDTIIARVGPFADTVRVTTLPITGVLAAPFVYSNNAAASGMAVMNLDGSNYREYAKGLSPAQPRFTYDNQSLIVQIATQGDARLWVVPLDASAPRRLIPSTTTLSEGSPAPSPDGQWIYYCATVPGQNRPPLHRVKLNGTSVERLPEPTPFLDDDICSASSISADGQWVAWHVPGDGRMKTRNIQSGVRTALNREGISPQFAPTGTRIAYIKGNPGPLYTADLDGSNDRLIASSFYSGPLSWSADGKYIFAYRGAQFAPGSNYELIEEATGKTFPLPFNLGFSGVLRPK